MTSHPASPNPAAAAFARRLLEHPLLLGMLLLVPIVWLLAPIPIDETRYLAVAWEMRRSGDFLVPHLNGAPYPHKPPLLFWLIDAGWLLTGVHAWTARAMTLLCSAASLLLLRGLVLRLGGSADAARAAMWILLGAIYFAGFANAIMFDVPLTTCVLIAVHGLCDLADGRRRRGVVLAGVAIGLGILVKGPVMLLDVASVGLAAPWWSGSLGTRRARYYGAFALALALGAAIALAWAVPAAVHGGSEYARAIFLNQTFDRIEGLRGASAHGRPWWWYLAIFPLMLLPWPLVVRGAWATLAAQAREPALRLAAVWIVPTFAAFSLIGGKQPHYLLPLLPAVALALAIAIERGAVRLRVGAFALFVIALGAAFALAPHYAQTRANLGYVEDASPGWGVALVAIGVALLAVARRVRGPAVPALAMLTVTLLVKIAIIEGPGARYDLGGAAERIRAAQQRGQPVVHLGWHHGVYEFAGRLEQPLPSLAAPEQFADWVRQHPDGLVVTFYRRFRFRAEPLYTQPFRGGEVSIWSAADALKSGIDPAAAHASDAVDAGDDD
ncbi:MAG TPA: glycosyltransferase family 39 protein [Dokdonella sp.]